MTYKEDDNVEKKQNHSQEDERNTKMNTREKKKIARPTLKAQSPAALDEPKRKRRMGRSGKGEGGGGGGGSGVEWSKRTGRLTPHLTVSQHRTQPTLAPHTPSTTQHSKVSVLRCAVLEGDRCVVCQSSCTGVSSNANVYCLLVLVIVYCVTVLWVSDIKA